jgi:hypothetical protein
MKMRNGFVSNSSSSSFIVVGRRLRSLEDVHRILKKGGAIRAETNRWGSDGLYYLNYANHKDLFNNYFEELLSYADWSFWEVFYEQESPISMKEILNKMSKDDLEDIEIFNIEADYHEPYDIAEFVKKEVGQYED